jgi:monovalent cation:H+ antiporter, CPA1 family
MVTVTALFSYVNHRYVGLPPVIGLMIMALAFSTLLIGAGVLYPAVQRNAVRIVTALDFDRLVLHAMLGFLLFAGTLAVDLNELRKHAVSVGVLATVGVVLSTVIIGGLTWFALSPLRFPLS